MQPNRQQQYYNPHPGRPTGGPYGPPQAVLQQQPIIPMNQMQPNLAASGRTPPRTMPSYGPGGPSGPSPAQRLAKQHSRSNSGNTRHSSHPGYRTHASMARSGTRISSHRSNKNNSLCPGCDCSFNTKYAMSMQGLCKALQIVCLLVTWAVIAATPYWRRYFIIDGYTWPFHIVMLLSITLWLVTVGLYFVFLLGWHFSYKSISWPGVELWYNFVGCVMMIAAAILQSCHVWRWDYRNGLPLQSQMPAGYTGNGRNMYQGGIGNLGLSGGLGGASLCGMGNNRYGGSRTHRDCMELLQAMAGINVYFGHHVFATIFLWIVVIEFIVSTYLAWKMFKKFERTFENDVQSIFGGLNSHFNEKISSGFSSEAQFQNSFFPCENPECPSTTTPTPAATAGTSSKTT